MADLQKDMARQRRLVLPADRHQTKSQIQSFLNKAARSITLLSSSNGAGWSLTIVQEISKVPQNKPGLDFLTLSPLTKFASA